MTALPPPGTARTLFVIDLSGYVFRAYHAVAPLSSPSGEPTHATFGTVNMLAKLIETRKPTLLAAAMDSREPSFRKQIAPDYKANRPPPPEDLSLQMNRCREIVEAHGITIWQQDGVEADDLIATAVRRARARDIPVVIVSADKDLMQLVTPQVVQWDPARDKVYGPQEVEAKFGVSPDRLRDLLALTGDTSDNVKGVPSIGPKTAAKLLADFGDIDNLYASLDRIERVKLREALAAHRNDAYLARRLVTLRDDLEIRFDETDLAFGRRMDLDRLLQIYTSLGFVRLAEAIQRMAPRKQIETRYTTVLTSADLQRAVARCEQSDAFAIDTETDSTDPMRARLVGLSLSAADGEAFYVPLTHDYLGAPNQLPIDEVRAALNPLLAAERPAKIGHNLKFDEIVLRRHGFEPIRAIASDTMIASYLLDPEGSHGLKDLAKRELGITMTTFEDLVGKSKTSEDTFSAVDVDKAAAYACADADMTRRLASHFAPKIDERGLRSLHDDVELPLSSVLVDMQMTGVLVDVSKLAALGRSVEAQLGELEALARKQAGRDFNVNSPRQLESILFDELRLRVVKRTKTSRSTDASVLEALAEDHELVGTILEHRQLSKLKSTYIDALPKLVHPHTGRIHTQFNQTVAATGRLSSSDPNLQNIPVRTDLGRAIREAFIAPDGYLIVSADYSQIELRVLAHLSNDHSLVTAFRDGDDVHLRTAMQLFGVDRAQVTPDQRRHAKTINFGVIYGMGEVALGKRLGIPREEAAKFISTYFERYEGVRTFMEETLRQARQTQMVTTLLNRPRHLPDLRSANPQLRAQAERIAGNTPIQGSAADILKLAMVRLRDPVVPDARMILTVHDELVFEVPADRVDEATARIRAAMQGVIDLRVPLIVDIGVASNWAGAH